MENRHFFSLITDFNCTIPFKMSLQTHIKVSGYCGAMFVELLVLSFVDDMEPSKKRLIGLIRELGI